MYCLDAALELNPKLRQESTPKSPALEEARISTFYDNAETIGRQDGINLKNEAVDCCRQQQNVKGRCLTSYIHL